MEEQNRTGWRDLALGLATALAGAPALVLSIAARRA
jgi:hypothetical protein